MDEFREREFDEQGNEIVEQPSEQEKAVTAEARKLLGAPDEYGETDASIDPLDAPTPDLMLDCRAFEPKDPNHYDVLELFEEDSKVYLDFVGTYEYTWSGCPC